MEGEGELCGGMEVNELEFISLIFLLNLVKHLHGKSFCLVLGKLTVGANGMQDMAGATPVMSDGVVVDYKGWYDSSKMFFII